jgi:hypothetical protein
MSEAANGFLSRWAQRKAQARSGAVAADAPALPLASEEPVAAVVADAANPVVPSASAPRNTESLPTLADVALLTRESDYSRFVVSGVDEGVKRAAMKKLFADPHFNVMDGLDTYIDDYGKPDPIPVVMLRQMNQSKILRLFDDEDDEAKSHANLATDATVVTIATDPSKPPDDDSDLRLQQDPPAGQPGADQGAGA